LRRRQELEKNLGKRNKLLGILKKRNREEERQALTFENQLGTKMIKNKKYIRQRFKPYKTEALK
jgi:hypothetical protein